MKLASLKKHLLPLFGLMGGLAAASAADPAYWSWSPTPPMGWNSWDCYGAGVWETNVVANADYMAKNLKSHGWNLVTIDIQWYEPLAHTDRLPPRRLGADGCQRPAAARAQPLSHDRGARSFKPMGDYLHAKGLKFGLHLHARHPAPGGGSRQCRPFSARATRRRTSPTRPIRAVGTATCTAWT